MKAFWIVTVIILVLGAGYFYRGQIGSMFGAAYPSPTSMNYVTTSTTSPTVSTGAILSWMGNAPSQYGVGVNGMTLYTYDKDTTGVGNCNGSCAGVWPPYTSTAKPASLSVNVTLITRADRSMQFAYKGLPLYYSIITQAIKKQEIQLVMA